MISKRQFVMGLLVPLLAIQLACHKKQAAQKTKLPGPAEAPTLTQTLPDEIRTEPLPANPQEAAATPEPPPTAEEEDSQESERLLRPATRHRARRLRLQRQQLRCTRRQVPLMRRPRSLSALT